ncbi:MAG: hypothetical protein ABI323_09155 [Solirubrobacteraceae bacterium]
MSYRDDLHRELTAVGITGRQRSRITDEIEDHLQCDPKADLGAPQLVARQFADELGTARARRAGFAGFAALALAGVLFGVAFVTAPGHAFGSIPGAVSWPGRVGNWVAVIAPQIAFAAGLLALLRALRRRTQRVIAAAETRMILRRATVGVFAGLASMIGLALLAEELRPYLPGWWVTLAWVCAGVGAVALLASTPVLLAAQRLPSLAEGSAGDLFDDVGAWLPRSLDGRPWRFALVVAGAIFVLMTVAGVLASDGPDGAVRGIADGLLCLLGFATLGRYLGLWSPLAD